MIHGNVTEHKSTSLLIIRFRQN